MTPSKIFLFFCISFIVGIFLNSIIKISQFYLLGFLFLGILIIFIPLILKNEKVWVIGFYTLFLVLGVLRHQIAEFKIENNELKKYNDSGQKITLTGIISKEPDTRKNSIKLTVKPENLNGKILITVNRYPEYQYGDKLKITGQLKTPEEFGDFDYPDYLAKDGIYSVIYQPKIELLKKNQGNWFYAKILFFKNKLKESIYQNLPPPQNSLLEAIILGGQSRMPEDLKEKLNITGLRHITAVSGMHIVILSGILMSLLIGLGFWRQQAFYLTIIVIFIFIAMIGFQASGVRAGIMGGFFLLAQYFGRLNTSSRIMFFAAALMLVQNPLLLRFDVGFQLSFLAVMGIIYLGPFLRGWLKLIPEEKFINLRGVLAMTFAAQIFTLPVLIYNFGRISVVAPLTNILIIPVIDLVMIFGFIFGAVGMFWETIGWILSFPAWLLLAYLIKITDFFSKSSFSSITFENVHWIWLLISYLILGILVKKDYYDTIKIWIKRHLKNLGMLG